MRFASHIVLALLIQSGLFARVAWDGLCCPDSSPVRYHACLHAHDDAAAPHKGDCKDDHGSPAGNDCPPDCGEHHHHGTCIHGMQMSLAGDGHHRLSPPHAVSLECERQHLRAPDGPVMEMDKPPLI